VNSLYHHHVDQMAITRIGFLAFNGVTQLDLTGPYEILSRLPNTETFIVTKDKEDIVSDRNLVLRAHKSLEEGKKLDILIVPGGPGVNDLLGDKIILDYVRESASRAKYTTSVCTGSLVLGAAGLLNGKRAATHWTAREFLKEFGATPVNERFVVDGNIITGGGVTAGIDFGLFMAAELAGKAAAEKIQLALEYDPRPPFQAGSPDIAPEEVVAEFRSSTVKEQENRRQAVMKAAATLLLARDG
jgi:cyclohexyl-isocyanide hydratase